MKRLIRPIYASAEVNLVDTSMFDGTPFKPTTTSGYDDFLNDEELKYHQSHKNRTGEIVMMSPTEYFNECVDNVFSGHTTFEGLLNSRRYDKNLNSNYADAMRKGAKFPLCYINYADKQQEGLHRMMTAGDIYGWDTKFPVLVVTAYNQETEELHIALDNYRSFMRYGTFTDVCRQALDDYIDYSESMEMPADFESSFRNAVVNTAANFEDGYDIDVTIDMVNNGGKHEANVYVTRFGVYEVPKDNLDEPYVVRLDYIYDFDEDIYQPKSTPKPVNVDGVDPAEDILNMLLV